jgi:hypothetical protein
MGVRELRREILEDCDTLQAIFAFNYHFSPKVKDALDAYRRLVPVSAARRLREMRDCVKNDLKNAASHYGCLQNPREIAARLIAGSVNRVPMMSISKAAIDRKWFTNFCGGIEDWKRFPPHLRLIVNFDRVSQTPTRFDYLLTEAMLYEDMALAYNEALSLEPQTRFVTDTTANLNVKRMVLFLRTAVLSAFYFVEAYLNGIG